MVLDFDKLRHLSQFSVPLLLAALVVIFFHNGNASFNLQLDADQRLKEQHESLQDIQAIFLDYLIQLQTQQTTTGDSLPLSIFPEFAPLPPISKTPTPGTSDNVSKVRTPLKPLKFFSRFKDRDRRH